QRGPGAANVAAALADAHWALSPVVSLTTAITNVSRDRYQYQDVDTLALHEAVTSWNRSLSAPGQVTAMVRAAIRAATGPVPGPVHLEIPADMLNVALDSPEIYAEADAERIGSYRFAAPDDRVRAVLEQLL